MLLVRRPLNLWKFVGHYMRWVSVSTGNDNDDDNDDNNVVLLATTVIMALVMINFAVVAIRSGDISD